MVVKVKDAKTTRKQSKCSAYDSTKKARLYLCSLQLLLGSRSLPDDFFPERKLLDEKDAIRLLPYRNVLDAKSRRYERS